MRKFFLIFPLTIFIPFAFGQLDSNSITVTASRNSVPGQPDLAVYNVQVSSGLDTNLDDVIAALLGSGITAGNFSAVNGFVVYPESGSSAPPTPGLNWTFQFSAPFTKTKDTVTMLNALQQSIAKKNSGLMMSFSIPGTQASAQSQTCTLPDLLADARTQAQKVADAGGVKVGNILAMSGSSPNGGSGSGQVASLGALVAPAFVGTYCVLTVKFALLRF